MVVKHDPARATGEQASLTKLLQRNDRNAATGRKQRSDEHTCAGARASFLQLHKCLVHARLPPCFPYSYKGWRGGNETSDHQGIFATRRGGSSGPRHIVLPEYISWPEGGLCPQRGAGRP